MVDTGPSPRTRSSRRKMHAVFAAGTSPSAGAQRWAAVGVLVLLVAVAGFVLITTRRVAGAMEAADRSAVVSDLGQDARFHAASAYAAAVGDIYHSNENRPDVAGRNATRPAIDSLTRTLQELKKTPGTDPAVIARLQTVVMRFAAATTRALDLVDRGQLRAAELVDRREVDPLANELTTTLSDMEEASYRSSQAHRNAAALEGRWVSGAMPFVLGGSLVIALLLALVFRRHRRAVEALACTDSLTGLPNRVGLGTGAKSTVGRDAGSPTAGSALLFLDLDRFKEVNDSLGHLYGDQLLVQVAQRLRQAVKGRDLVARLGGDEFAVLIADGGEQAARLVADRIHSLLLQPFALDQLTVEIGVSIGIAVVSGNRSDLAASLRCADVAMYAAKELGGGSVAYTAEQDGRLHDGVRVVSGLRRALSQDELVVHYEPKIAPRSR
jgi:diguanylate cyclase (GGDEF)-like protein